MDADRERDSLWDVPPGLAGIDTMLPLLVDEGVHGHGLRYERLAELLCGNPARRFGLYPRKGALRVGADADFVILDPDAQWTFSWTTCFAKSRSVHTPLEGRRIRGKVLRTMLRGNTVYDNGNIIAQPDYGTFARPLHHAND